MSLSLILLLVLIGLLIGLSKTAIGGIGRIVRENWRAAGFEPGMRR
jgi:hypothetical protein